MSDLEKDFEEVANKINNKIKEAAEAMKEANNIAKKFGAKSLTLDPYGEDYGQLPPAQGWWLVSNDSVPTLELALLVPLG
jgi:hypothetical protein